MKLRLFLLVFFVLASIPALYQIITPGYFPVHDDTQVVRVQQMYKALQQGQFPVRWAPDLGYGYGYPIFNFYNPLPYYVGALFMLLGFDPLIAAKFMFVIPIILSGAAMYFFARLVLSRWGALAASVLYLYAPYHGVQIYVRGAVGEYWAYALLPLVFFAIWKKKVIFGALVLSFLILSHNLTAFMSIPFIVLLIALKVFKTKNKKLLFTIYGLLFTFALGASAFFWLPALFQAKLTQVSHMVFSEFDPPSLHTILPQQLWTSIWGYGGSSPGADDGLSLQLGKIHVIGSIAAIAAWLYSLVKKRGDKLITFSILGLLFSVFILLPYSAFIWNAFPVLSYIQFPWRFLTFASLFSSVLAAVSISKAVDVLLRQASVSSVKFLPFTVYCLLFTIFIFYSFKFFQPRYKFPTAAAELTTMERIVWEVSNRSHEYVPVGFELPKTKQEALRIDNEKNKQIVASFRKRTIPLQTIANGISIFSISCFGWYAYGRRRTYS